MYTTVHNAVVFLFFHFRNYFIFLMLHYTVMSIWVWHQVLNTTFRDKLVPKPKHSCTVRNPSAARQNIRDKYCKHIYLYISDFPSSSNCSNETKRRCLCLHQMPVLDIWNYTVEGAMWDSNQLKKYHYW